MMLVITGSNSLLLSLMSRVGIGSSMQPFAGDLQIIFHTSSSVVFRRTFRVETGGDCAISRLMSEQSGRLSLILSIFCGPCEKVDSDLCLGVGECGSLLFSLPR